MPQLKHNVVGAEMNRLNEMVLFSTQNMFKLMDKKIIKILHSKFCVSGSTSSYHICIKSFLKHVSAAV